MDVTRPPLPTQRSTLSAHAAFVAHAVQPRAAAVASPAEVNGVTDGPDLVLPSGVRFRRKRVGSSVVTQQQLTQAIRGVQLLPFEHQVLIARMGIPIQLVPVTNLEQVPGTRDPVVGATAVIGPEGRGAATAIRIATRMGELPNPTAIREVVQHEIGHVIAVTASQDRSEATAEAYARRY